MAREGIPKNQKLWESVKRIVKRQYTTWPSAYASGALVKLYKAKGGKFRDPKAGES
jgi:hypothetical protein